MISWKNITKARCLENSFFLRQKQKRLVWMEEFILFLKTISYFYFMNSIYNNMKYKFIIKQ